MKLPCENCPFHITELYYRSVLNEHNEPPNECCECERDDEFYDFDNVLDYFEYKKQKKDN